MHNGYPPRGPGPDWPATGPSRRDITPPSDPTLRFGPETGHADGRSRADGLRRLSRLTWRTTQLSAVAAAAFAVLFARSAPAQTASGQTQARPSSTPSSTPAHAASPTPTVRHKNPHNKHKARHARVSQAAAQPSASAAAQPSGAAAQPSSAAPTLAPPMTPPAAAPSPSPVQSTSSGTHSGG